MNSEYYLLILTILAVSFVWILNLNPDVLSQVHNNNRSDILNKTSPISQKSNEMYIRALMYYDKALAINPNATDILNNKGMVLIKLGKYDEALKVLDKILSLDPKNVAGLYNKGVALDKLGNHIEAKQFQQKALQINPKYIGDFINRLGAANSVTRNESKSKLNST